MSGSRTEILSWINSLLQLDLKKIEDTASGAVACQILDCLYPDSLPLSRVNFLAHEKYEYLKNYKLLQAAFLKLQIDKNIEVDKLINAKPQDNLLFMQWFRSYFDSHYNGQPYNAIERRKNCRGGMEVTSIVQSKANHSITSPTAPSSGTTSPSCVSPRSGKVPVPTSVNDSLSVIRRPSSDTMNSVLHGTSLKRMKPGVKVSSVSSPASSLPQKQSLSRLSAVSNSSMLQAPNPMDLSVVVSELEQQIDQLTQEMCENQKEKEELKIQTERQALEIKTICSERDFYCEKLVSIEEYMNKQEMAGITIDHWSAIRLILYATSTQEDKSDPVKVKEQEVQDEVNETPL